MKFVNKELEQKANELLKSELVLDSYGIVFAIRVADSMEKELDKGYELPDVWEEVWKESNIPPLANWGGTIYHKLIKYWKHGEELRDYLIQKAPITAKYIGLYRQ